MKTFGAIATVSAAFFAATNASPAQKRQSKTTPITVKGNAFWQGDTRFYIRGVDYQPGGEGAKKDPIADSEHCKRDIEKFKELGLNTVRIYTVDNSKNHDECMSALADAGIYLALDVNSPTFSLNRADPKPSYNDVYLQNVFATIDAFAKYDNTLLFFSANEVINDNATTITAPYVKAVTRDMRQYISARKYRQIPVGYSAADVDSNRFEMAQYMNCGPDDARSDFFAFNDYSWCDPSTFQISGWDKKVKQYGNYSLPLFLSEFGCNTNKREFNEITALYSNQMSAVYSGGLVYEYSQEKSNYGLVEIKDEEVTIRDDFTTLKNQLAKTKNPSGDGGYKASGSASECPARSASWEVDSNWLPAIPEPAKAYMTKGAGAGVGIVEGMNSQYAGTASTENVTLSNSGSSSSGSSGKKNAAVSTRVPAFTFAPFVTVFLLLASSFLGVSII